MRDVPALSVAVAKLNTAVAANTDRQRDMERFLRSLDSTSQKLPPKYVEQMARSLADKINQTPPQNDEKMLRELERLRIEVDDMRDVLATKQAQTKDPGFVDTALQGEAGNAISRLDFKTANGILEKLNDLGAYSSNSVLLGQVRQEADQAWGKLISINAKEKCPSGMAVIGNLRQSAVEAEQRGQYNTAGTAYSELRDRAIGIVSELQTLEFMASTRKMAFDQRRNIATMLRGKVQRFVSTDQQNQHLEAMDALLAQADALGNTGHYGEGLKKITDALNLLSKIKPGLPSFPSGDLGGMQSFSNPAAQCDS